MKKSNQFSNKLIARKDLINSISVASAFLIVIFGIIMFLLVLSPEQDVNGKITFLIEQRMMYTLDGSYNFSAEQENVLLVAIIGGLALGISQFEFLHRKKYASTLFSFSIKRSKLFLNIKRMQRMNRCIFLLRKKYTNVKINIRKLRISYRKITIHLIHGVIHGIKWLNIRNQAE